MLVPVFIGVVGELFLILFIADNQLHHVRARSGGAILSTDVGDNPAAVGGAGKLSLLCQGNMVPIQEKVFAPKRLSQRER